jgi:hypothetical protein
MQEGVACVCDLVHIPALRRRKPEELKRKRRGR